MGNGITAATLKYYRHRRKRPIARSTWPARQAQSRSIIPEPERWSSAHPAVTVTGAGIKHLGWAGSTTGIGTFAGVLPDFDTTNTTTLSKSGTGTWNLTGTSTYTGETIFAGGILNVASLSDYGVPSSIGARPASAENGTVTGCRPSFSRRHASVYGHHAAKYQSPDAHDN